MLATGAFAVDVSMDMAANVGNPEGSGGFTLEPNVGVDLGLGKKFDVMAGLKFNMNIGIGSDAKHDRGWVTIIPYADLWFPVLQTDKIKFGPLVGGQVGIRVPTGDDSGDTKFVLGIPFGARLQYELNENWGLYTGFKSYLINFTFGDDGRFQMLSGGDVQLGINYKF
jgi:hypothetical protein